MADVVWFPPEVVEVPRSVFEKWASRPYSEIVHAAERGEDGLLVRSGKDLAKSGTATLRPPSRGERFAPNTALVYSQGW